VADAPVAEVAVEVEASNSVQADAAGDKAAELEAVTENASVESTSEEPEDDEAEDSVG
jgi:hypothetical protein